MRRLLVSSRLMWCSRGQHSPRSCKSSGSLSLSSQLTAAQIWSTSSLTCLYVVNPYLETDAGDIFALAWCAASHTLFLGCQNTSIQVLACGDLASEPRPTADTTPGTPADGPSTISPPGSVGRKSRVHKFFDSYPQYERRAADALARNGAPQGAGLFQGVGECLGAGPLASQPTVLDIPPEHVIDSAHYGYVYAMAIIGSTCRDGAEETSPSKYDGHIVTGSGDETLKVCLRRLTPTDGTDH
jgi:di- and tripeptidase